MFEVIDVLVFSLSKISKRGKKSLLIINSNGLEVPSRNAIVVNLHVVVFWGHGSRYLVLLNPLPLVIVRTKENRRPSRVLDAGKELQLVLNHRLNPLPPLRP